MVLGGVEKHRGRANSLNNSRLAVITDEGDRLWILFALAAVSRARYTRQDTQEDPFGHLPFVHPQWILHQRIYMQGHMITAVSSGPWFTSINLH